jgi:hypothetical protein
MSWADTLVTELATGPKPPAALSTAAVARTGYDSAVPVGGASRFNPSTQYADGRLETMRQFKAAYVACPWVSAPIDALARTVTAGGLVVEPEDGTEAEHPPAQVLALRQFLKFVNPTQNVVQFMRGVVTDSSGIYGDSFTELVWLLGRPVAMYSLDAATMTVDADEHGNVSGYTQTDGTRTAKFKPHEVIQISADSPGGELYGMGIVEKLEIPIATWLYTAALVKEQTRKGDPPHLNAHFGLAVAEPEITKWRQQYHARNLGAANVGNPIVTKGDTTITSERVGKITEWLATMADARDAIVSGSGVPPSKVGIIETGNLGGGTGSSQDKTFRVNTCGPASEIVLEAFNFVLLQAFGVEGWSIGFGDVDWRDDETVEKIRDQRLRSGAWTLNEYRADIDKPPIGEAGDINAIIATRTFLDWNDLAAFSDKESAPAPPPPEPKAPVVVAPGEVPPALAKAGDTPPAPPEAPPGSDPATTPAKPGAKATAKAEGYAPTITMAERIRRTLLNDRP